MKKALLLALIIMFAVPMTASADWFLDYVNNTVEHPQQDVTYIAYVRAPNLVQLPYDINLEAVVEKDVELNAGEGWTVKAGVVIPWGLDLSK